jgi:hypothetical protein
LPAEIQDQVRVGQLTTGHAKLLKGVTDHDKQVALAKEIVARALSVHATEALLKQPPAEDGENKDGGAMPRKTVEKTSHVQGVENELRQKLSIKVEIKLKAKDRGQLVLAFESNDDFERILEALRKLGRAEPGFLWRCLAGRDRYKGRGRGVAQVGSAPALGAGGQRFESARPDNRTRGQQLTAGRFIPRMPEGMGLYSAGCEPG